VEHHAQRCRIHLPLQRPLPLLSYQGSVHLDPSIATLNPEPSPSLLPWPGVAPSALYLARGGTGPGTATVVHGEQIG
jgi:hypothetical protein